MASVLDVTGEDLDRLSTAEAIELFSGLLWADSRARGICAKIDVHRNANARDGGIDGTVRAPADTAGQGVIGPGVTRYRIKSGRGRDPAAMWARRRLLFRPDGGLRSRIKRCLDAGEALVVVLFGTAASGRERDLEHLIREDLAGADPSYRDARVEVWCQDRLIEHICKYPVLQRRLKGVIDVPFHTHSQWASISTDMTRRFVRGPSQGALIDEARSALRDMGGADVRITGRPGSGKTRIAHEITRADDMAALVLYFENPSHARLGSFLNDLLDDDGISAILVVDECDTESWRYFRNRTAGTGGRVRLVTMYDKKDSQECYEVGELGLAETREIIEGYGAEAADEAVAMLAHRCDPSPRYAHHVGEIMASGAHRLPGLSLGEAAVHERYIKVGLSPHDEERARKRKAVLLCFSAFARVDCEGPGSCEYELLRKKCGQEYWIAPNEFDSIVDELRGLKILRGSKALHIAPYTLRLWLWSEWRRIHRHGSALETLPTPGGDMPDAPKRTLREMDCGVPTPG